MKALRETLGRGGLEAIPAVREVLGEEKFLASKIEGGWMLKSKISTAYLFVESFPKQKLQITGASVAAAAQAQALSGITNVATPIGVSPVATPNATASPAAAGIPILGALSSATPLVTSAASPGPAATGSPIVAALSSAVPLVSSGH